MITHRSSSVLAHKPVMTSESWKLKGQVVPLVKSHLPEQYADLFRFAYNKEVEKAMRQLLFEW